MRLMCEDSKRLMGISEDFWKASALYADGDRTPRVLRILASAKVLSDNLGQLVPLVGTYDRDTWDTILSVLVKDYLGDLRCLNCFGYFKSGGNEAYSPSNRPGQSTIRIPQCPQCGGVISEEVACVQGIAG